jgi:hypothetical protein
VTSLDICFWKNKIKKQIDVVDLTFHLPIDASKKITW